MSSRPRSATWEPDRSRSRNAVSPFNWASPGPSTSVPASLRVSRWLNAASFERPVDETVVLLRLSSRRPVSRWTEAKPEIGDLRYLQFEFLEVREIFEKGELRIAQRSGSQVDGCKAAVRQLSASAHQPNPCGNRLGRGIGGLRGSGARRFGERGSIETDLDFGQRGAQRFDAIGGDAAVADIDVGQVFQAIAGWPGRSSSPASGRGSRPPAISCRPACPSIHRAPARLADSSCASISSCADAPCRGR